MLLQKKYILVINDYKNTYHNKFNNEYFEGIKDGKFLNRGLKNCEIKEYEI